MGFTLDDLQDEMVGVYKVAGALTSYINGIGWNFDDNFTYLDFMMEDHVEYLIAIAYANGQLTDRDANVINTILGRNIPKTALNECYYEQIRSNDFHDHTKAVSPGIALITEFESKNKQYISHLPSPSLQFCEVMDKIAIVFLNVIDDPTGKRNKYYEESINVMQNHLRRLGLL